MLMNGVMPMPPARNTAGRVSAPSSVNLPAGPRNCIRRPDCIDLSTRLNAVSRMRVAMTSSFSCGALTMEKVRALPLASVSGGSISDTFIACPAVNLNPAGLAKWNAIVPSATGSLDTSVVSYLGITMLLCGVFSGPGDLVIVEAARDGGLHDLEVGRDVEIARCEQAVMADVHHLVIGIVAPGFTVVHESDFGQDRVVHRLERFGDQRRADCARRIAAPEGDHAAAPAHRHGRGRD